MASDDRHASAAAANGGSMTLMEHLVELRQRLTKCVIAVLIGGIVGWIIFPDVFHFLLQPMVELCKHSSCLLNGHAGNVLNTDPLDPLVTRVKLSAFIGIALAMPVLLWQIWRFVAPGLYSNERRYALAFIGPALLLFVGGAAVAYEILPYSLDWLQSIGGSNFTAAYTADKFTTLVGWMMLAFGAAFQFPVILVALEVMGVVNSRQLRHQWRYWVAGIAVVAGVITPSGDPISFLFMAVPMVFLYGVAILIGMVIDWRRRKAAA
jgi:sec-independent protein translocase protein TatC